ncbi:LuxR C-terminal-related transcriptional regulator [Hoyosella sp. YIM 151337]|uniref:LuxR C-terminal-related transcriptional regulator n=1 Tax=Hoyosella sp. YIM 151337 TaxID=2992742 RepID=UPI0022362FFE|nr:LuxR C-terminal-related transcriptional regulator [Hoyosella sp. YIM 151337]MCW4353041.1 LuxR C-terminal-related transcriptional regulator [Hoyosella sp. YIM 151337]
MTHLIRQSVTSEEIMDTSVHDTMRAALRRAKADTQLPVVFSGDYTGKTLTLNRFIGMRTDGLRNLGVSPGAGLGGRCAASGRPLFVSDYTTSEGISHDYVDVVREEGLRSMLAVPVLVNKTVRAVLYGAVREATNFGDSVRGALFAAAKDLGDELRVREEVERRAEQAEFLRADMKAEMAGADRETLRMLHSELRAIAAQISDPELRDRLTRAGAALVSVGRPDDPTAAATAPVAAPSPIALPTLTPREIDVLSQVALGCTNGEVAGQLALSAETVKAYLRSAATKLGTRTRMESVTRARLLGLLP